jgi:hypothetical protein
LHRNKNSKKQNKKKLSKVTYAAGASKDASALQRES